jgi:signal peptidase I
VTAPLLADGADTERPSSPARRVGRALLGLFVPSALTILTMRFLMPARLEGVRGGLARVLATASEEHPLLLGVALFVVFSELSRYWRRRLGDARVDAEAPRPRPLHRRTLRRLLVSLALVAAAAFVIRSSIAAAFKVVGPSMLPTFEVGDRILVNRLAYGVALPFTKTRLAPSAPQRGDLVVFRAHGLRGVKGADLVVKRVIGVPGDYIALMEGALTINGWRVPTCDAGPYVSVMGRLTVRGRLTVEYLGDKAYLTVRKPIEAPFPGYEVKAGEVFVLGDDRGLSSDSRLWSDGNGSGVPIDVLEGRVQRVLVGARPDGRLDFSRVFSRALDAKVRLPGFDLTETDKRIGDCLARRPREAVPPLAPQR